MIIIFQILLRKTKKNLLAYLNDPCKNVHYFDNIENTFIPEKVPYNLIEISLAYLWEKYIKTTNN
jgi:hypothetical protein